MSRPLALPVRLFSQQSTRQNFSTQCLRQKTGYMPLDSNIKQQWHKPATRSFATSPKSHAAGGQAPRMRQPAQPSVTRMQREQQEAMVRDGKLPDDVGLLQDTFVLPRNPTDRHNWRLRKKWFKVRFTELYSLLAYKWLVVRPRPKLEISKIAPMAAKMHESMYKDFAAGNMAAMQNDVCTGLFGSLRARVQQRKPNTFLRWSIKKHLSAPKLCSYKAAVLPGGKGELNTERNAQIQAVVKLHTLQSLQHAQRIAKREGIKGALVTREENLGPEEEKESVEYIVVQRSMRKGKLNPWQIWGFTNETTLEQVDREAAK